MEEKKFKKISWSLTSIFSSIFIILLLMFWGIDAISITWSFALSSIFALITFLIIRHKCDDLDEFDMFPILGIVFALFIALIITTSLYNSAIDMPFRYKAANDTVEQTEALLLKYESNTTFANGLEAFELKQSLKDIIQERNNLKADIYSWLANPFMPFKDIIRNNLK